MELEKGELYIQLGDRFVQFKNVDVKHFTEYYKRALEALKG